MDNRRFDAVTRSFGHGGSRRTLIKGLLGIGGAVALGEQIAAGDVEAARRPTPTPKPVKCPGSQQWNGTACVCTTGTNCGSDCCAGASVCCDGACCNGVCYGEEQCCPTGQEFCEETGECCAPGVPCCPHDCPAGQIWSGGQCVCEVGTLCGTECCDGYCTGNEVCCPSGREFCEVSGQCCPENTICCWDGSCQPEQCAPETTCSGNGVWIPATQQCECTPPYYTCPGGEWCAASECCDGADCDSGVCNANGTCCVPSCAPGACGDDGCGGTCGTCGSGYACIERQCFLQYPCPDDGVYGVVSGTGYNACICGSSNFASCATSAECPSGQLCFAGQQICLPGCLEPAG